MSMFGNSTKDYWYEEMEQMLEELTLEDITDIFYYLLKDKKIIDKKN